MTKLKLTKKDYKLVFNVPIDVRLHYACNPDANSKNSNVPSSCKWIDTTQETIIRHDDSVVITHSNNTPIYYMYMTDETKMDEYKAIIDTHYAYNSF